jgi:hypothetical protein
MRKRFQIQSNQICLAFVLALLSCACLPFAAAQDGAGFGAEQAHKGKERAPADRLSDKPSQPPAFTIPVEALGFSPPGANYLGLRNCLASLDFLDENRLLFTFRVPGLMHRDPGVVSGSDERQIRALVLSLPTGRVEAEALWTVHDRLRYLWMLNDGHFLLRNRDALEQGDATLRLKPMLHFPGPLLSIKLDPTWQYLVTNSREPAQATPKPGEVAGPASAAVGVTVDGEKPASQSEFVLRILRRDSGQVMLVSRVNVPVHLPINAEGYLESLRGSGQQWILDLNFFSGGSRVLGRVDSFCSPTYDFVSPSEVLVTACLASGANRLVAMDTEGRKLWEQQSSDLSVWPLLAMAPDGSRVARETLVASHPVNASSTIDDVKGQMVRVFDAANGNVALEAPANPVLDGGGNMAISPSGRRVVVLNGGALQIFELPAPPSLPEPAASLPGR